MADRDKTTPPPPPTRRPCFMHAAAPSDSTAASGSRSLATIATTGVGVDASGLSATAPATPTLAQGQHQPKSVWAASISPIDGY